MSTKRKKVFEFSPSNSYSSMETTKTFERSVIYFLCDFSICERLTRRYLENSLTRRYSIVLRAWIVSGTMNHENVGDRLAAWYVCMREMHDMLDTDSPMIIVLLGFTMIYITNWHDLWMPWIFPVEKKTDFQYSQNRQYWNKSRQQQSIRRTRTVEVDCALMGSIEWIYWYSH
jgi:hypothetical protein